MENKHVNSIENFSVKELFTVGFNHLSRVIFETNHSNGFWDKPRNKSELIALIHSELSEALEALRHDNPPDKHLPEFYSVEVELADAVIRIMDMAHGFGYNLSEAIVAKAEYNKSRGYKHGKRF